MGFHVLGSTGKLADFVADYEMVVAIGNAQIRQRIMNQVDAVNGKIATVDHECRISDYVHVLVGAHLAGSVVGGERSWVGISAVVSNNLTNGVEVGIDFSCWLECYCFFHYCIKMCKYT